LVLVEGDRQMRSQVNPTTYIFFVLVKEDRQKGSQVSPTTHSSFGFGFGFG
jgi:hypothetical protein